MARPESAQEPPGRVALDDVRAADKSSQQHGNVYVGEACRRQPGAVCTKKESLALGRLLARDVIHGVSITETSATDAAAWCQILPKKEPRIF